MGYRLGVHARNRIAERTVGDFASEVEVLRAVNLAAPKFPAGIAEVHVVVKRTSYQVINGQSGDMVIAAVDPRTQVVKTVMLRGSWKTPKHLTLEA